MEQRQLIEVEVNEAKVAELIATRIVDLRSQLADIKDALELQEATFKDLGHDVTLVDGTKVAIVHQNRRSIDNDTLKDVLPQGQHQRVTKRVGDMKLIDGAIEAGWLDADVVGQAINIKAVESVKVTQPKREKVWLGVASQPLACYAGKYQLTSHGGKMTDTREEFLLELEEENILEQEALDALWVSTEYFTLDEIPDYEGIREMADDLLGGNNYA